jgi:hypothetical protein
MTTRIAFIGNSEPADYLLKLFSKFTPKQSGTWGKLVGVDSYDKADVFAVIDYLPNHLKNKINEKNTIYLGAHPPEMSAYHDMSNYKCLAKFDCKYTLGFLEYWLSYDYDYLSALKPNIKNWKLCSIVSNARTQSYHTKRIDFLKRFTTKLRSTNEEFHLFGRIVPDTEDMKYYYRGVRGESDARGFATSGKDHMYGKEEVYSLHKYALEFDAFSNGGYFSERVADSLLMWSMPIYWGGQNVHKVLPENSFRYLNIDASGEDVLEIINSDFYEKNLDAVAEARNIILNQELIWPKCHKVIYGVHNV